MANTSSTAANIIQYAASFLNQFAQRNFPDSHSSDKDKFKSAVDTIFKAYSTIGDLWNQIQTDYTSYTYSNISSRKAGDILLWDNSSSDFGMGIVLPDNQRILVLNPNATKLSSVPINNYAFLGGFDVDLCMSENAITEMIVWEKLEDEEWENTLNHSDINIIDYYFPENLSDNNIFANIESLQAEYTNPNNNGLVYFYNNKLRYRTPNIDISSLRVTKGMHSCDGVKKSQIYLHHTVSDGKPDVVYKGLMNRSTGSDFVISGKLVSGSNHLEGQIYELFNHETQWSHHLGIHVSDIEFLKSKKAYTDIIFPSKNTASNWISFYKHCIGIEICSLGAAVVQLPNGSFIQDGRPNNILNSNDIITYTPPFHGKSFFEKYTDNQLASLKLLLIFLCDKNGITKKNQGELIFDRNHDAFAGRPGIYAHVSVRPDKSDVQPQAELLLLLNELSALAGLEWIIKKSIKDIEEKYQSIFNQIKVEYPSVIPTEVLQAFISKIIGKVLDSRNSMDPSLDIHLFIQSYIIYPPLVEPFKNLAEKIRIHINNSKYYEVCPI